MHTPDTTFTGSAIDIAAVPAVTSEYDTWDSAVLTHAPTGRRFLVRWDRSYHLGRIRDRIMRFAEFVPGRWKFTGSWRDIELDTPATVDWWETSYRNPDELLTACEGLVLLIVTGDAA